jgi:hypothetical protein
MVEPIFYARLGAGILAIHVGEFRDNIIKFETFKVQEFDDVVLFEFHRNGTFQLSMICFIVSPDSFTHGNPKFSHNPSITRGCSCTRFHVEWEMGICGKKDEAVSLSQQFEIRASILMTVREKIVYVNETIEFFRC